MIGKILISVFGLVSELELENIRIRVTESIKKRNLEGKSYGGRYVNLGYQRLRDEKGKTYFVTNDDEADVIKMIFDYYIQGMNVTAIAVKLNKMNYKTRTNRPFNESSVERILKNPIYIGKIKPIKSNMDSNAKEVQLIEGLHKPIISMEVWNQAQERMNQQKIIKTDHEIYLFSGKLICYKCGARMYGEWSGTRKKKIKYYSCHNNHRINPCNAPAVRADVIDNMLIESLIKLINSSIFMDFLQSNLIKEVYNNRTENSNISNLQEELISLRKRKQFFDEQYEKGIINETLYVKGDVLFNERFNYLTNQLTYLKNSINMIDTKTESHIKKDIKVFVNELSKLLKNSYVNIKYKTEIISELVKSVEIDNKSVEPKFMLQISQNLFTKILGKVNDTNKNLSFIINFV